MDTNSKNGDSEAYPYFSTHRAVYDWDGTLLRPGAPNTPEVHAARIEILEQHLKDAGIGEVEVNAPDVLQKLFHIFSKVRMVWSEMTEEERADLASRFPAAVRLSEMPPRPDF